MRIGGGYDIHKLVAGLPLKLGGLELESSLGCLAHSDGDVLLHAIIDSLLGALALGDIGTHFPPHDPQWENADSRLLLSQSYQLLRARGYQLINLDSTIILEKPILRPHIYAIRSSIARVLGVDTAIISVKAKTKEALDSVGLGQAIECHAQVLIDKI